MGPGQIPMGVLTRNVFRLLEMLLLVDDPWKTIMTTDHPNGGVFTKYPQVIAWLLSKRARDETAAECHKWGYDRSSLGGIEREMTLFEIAILTRANAARTIGMAYRKGHLGAGADGDVAIYDIDPERFSPDDAEKVIRAFGRAACTIKDGQVVVRDGEVVAVPDGRRYYCEPKVDEGLTKDMMADVREWFKYYTIGFANYPVPDKYLRNPEPIVVNGPAGAGEGW